MHLFAMKRLDGRLGKISHQVIIIPIKETRWRNQMALVCKKWHEMESSTREYLFPMCFQSVTKLDLSVCSPWGYPPLDSTTSHGKLIGLMLKQAFPRVNTIVINLCEKCQEYRNVVLAVAPFGACEIGMRWHRRSMDPESPVGLGMELVLLMCNCVAMKSLDLSQFYWTEGIPPALRAEPHVSANLSSLNLLKVSEEGFKAQELAAISGACRNLEELFSVCVFDPRYMDCVGAEALVTLARNCPRIRILHLVDATAFGGLRGDPQESLSGENAKKMIRLCSRSLHHLFPQVSAANG